MTSTAVRRWHLLTAAVAIGALTLQLLLVVFGEPLLVEEHDAGAVVRLARFASYFTIQSNTLVAITALQLARDPDRDGPGWRVLRAAAIAGITMTGIVHFIVLRPLLDLEGWSWAADKLLHLAVPALAVVGWAAFGPRPRITLRVVGWALVWPIAWLVWTLSVGAVTGWYPYPFLDIDAEGAGSVTVSALGVTVLFVIVFAALHTVDRRAAPCPRPG